jgi:putative SOS response-associated peptidase YedK
LHNVADAFDLAPTLAQEDATDAPWRPRYNIAPTQQVAAIRTHAGSPQRELAWMRWGLIPSWADDPAIGNRMINARGETLAEKPAYREAFRRRRCLIPADGFYEWKQGAKPKQPNYIYLKNEQPFAFAGLWESWQHAGQTIESCTIITTEANELLRPLHERMPVILGPDDYETWLDASIQNPERLEPLLVPYPADRMTLYPVSSAVNSPRCDDASCLERAAPVKTQGTLFDW